MFFSHYPAAGPLGLLGNRHRVRNAVVDPRPPENGQIWFNHEERGASMRAWRLRQGVLAASTLVVANTFCLFAYTQAQTQDDPRNFHGTFTGEIKAVLYVSDVEQSVPFYRDVLGFDFAGFANSHGEPYYGEMVAKDVKFGLHEPMSDDQEPKVGKQRLYFRVLDLESHRARVLARDGNPGEIRRTDWMDMFLVRDPDGNEIVFAVTDSTRHSINPWNTHAATTKGN